jgi:Rrf2 family protein
MFSQTLEYALRAVVCMAQHADKPMTTQNLSELTKVPASYMSKVLQQLGRAQLIHATRGIGGGYVLAIPPDRFSILQVVNAIEPLKRIRSCPLRIGSHGKNLCPLHHRLDRVMEDAEEAFGKTMLSDLLSDPTRSTPLCENRRVQISLGKK